MNGLIGIVLLFALAYLIVSAVKKKADSVGIKKDQQLQEARERADKERKKAEREARKELTEKIAYYKELYDEDFIKYLVKEYGEYFEDFVDDEEEYEEFKKSRE